MTDGWVLADALREQWVKRLPSGKMLFVWKTLFVRGKWRVACVDGPTMMLNECFASMEAAMLAAERRFQDDLLHPCRTESPGIAPVRDQTPNFPK